ncbi:MAG: hypothetical protein F3741_04490 [Nitrospinae bacterium]|nr:hypothetical protein [Nitrospinota bacterium]
MRFKSHIIIKIIVLCVFLLPSQVLSEEDYKSAFEKAQNLDKEKFYEDAKSYWEKTIEASPPANIALYAKLKLTNTYTRLGQLDKAIEVSRELTKSNHNNFDVWFHFANVLASSKKYAQATEAFEQTIALNPEEGLSRVGLAFAHFGNEKPDIAIEELKKAMKTFKANKNISWYRDCRLAINQIKGFARFPPNFAELWLENNLKRVQETYMEAVLNLENLLHQ